MHSIKCCILGCKNAGGVHNHRFPNPRRDFDRFKKWLDILNIDKLKAMDPFYVYCNKRICCAHFDFKYKSPGNPRLHHNAVPFVGQTSESDDKNANIVEAYIKSTSDTENGQTSESDDKNANKVEVYIKRTSEFENGQISESEIINVIEVEVFSENDVGEVYLKTEQMLHEEDSSGDAKCAIIKNEIEDITSDIVAISEQISNSDENTTDKVEVHAETTAESIIKGSILTTILQKKQSILQQDTSSTATTVKPCALISRVSDALPISTSMEDIPNKKPRIECKTISANNTVGIISTATSLSGCFAIKLFKPVPKTYSRTSNFT